MASWFGPGCDECRNGVLSGDRHNPEPVASSVKQHARLLRCRFCGSYWAEGEREAHVITEPEARSAFPEHFEENYTVFPIGGADDEQATLSIEEIGRDCRIICRLRGETRVAEAADYFEALARLRRRALEPLGLIPFCYGASLNVWPSGMSRDMALGLTAYVVKPGEPAKRIVNIFDDGPDVIPSSVANREEFACEWMASLRKL
jgi:hypothetical protein